MLKFYYAAAQASWVPFLVGSSTSCVPWLKILAVANNPDLIFESGMYGFWEETCFYG